MPDQGQQGYQHPVAVVVARREPIRDRSYTPQISERLPVVESVQTAPRPVDYTSAYGVGRDAMHAWGFRWLYQSLALQDKLSIVGWPWSGSRPLSTLRLSQPRAGQNPIQERSNIQQAGQVAYGDLTEQPPQALGSPAYAKLI